MSVKARREVSSITTWTDYQPTLRLLAWPANCPRPSTIRGANAIGRLDPAQLEAQSSRIKIHIELPCDEASNGCMAYDRAKHLEMIGKAIERMDKAAFSLKALSPAALGVALILIERRVPAWLALATAALAVSFQ